ncbi:MAG: hypothetical protein PVG66_12410 [Chromatiales bacterium]
MPSAFADRDREKRKERRSSGTLAAAAIELSISEAKWEAGDSLLVVKGKGPARTSVVIRDADSLSVVGNTLSDREGKWRLKKRLSKSPCRVQAAADGFITSKTVENSPGDCGSGGSGGGSGGGGGDAGGSTPAGQYVPLASNDLGMHCADLDYQIFSILPPYNVVHGQVIKKGEFGSSPRIMTENEIDLYYKAVPSPSDTVPPDTITSTSANINGQFKTNFWYPDVGRQAYDPLYPEGVLDGFDLPVDVGLPAPDIERLHLGDGVLQAHQQAMPGVDDPGAVNRQQKFLGYLNDLPFFKNFPFGYVADSLNRHTAEGIPILPASDPDAQGRVWESAYPLMQVTAVKQGTDPENSANQLGSIRVVLPVGFEADCQSCHADQDICDFAPNLGLACTGVAASMAYTDFDVITVEEMNTVPGETPTQTVINASKINILRLHDAKHDTDLDTQRKVVCATCHYSPALDLAQLGPNDDNGKQQTQHISMSRAMHGHHGEFTDLFPSMPEPGNRNASQVQDILQETCYACHPGKRTQCLRGAMTQSGIVCQDCHGDMQQVGDDFSAHMPNIDWNKRIPWASEPGCQSCHTGDAVNNLAGTPGAIVADDGIRLLQAYRSGDSNAEPIKAVNRRFAETRDSSGNDHLYRLSKGHGGVMCEGCHGSTHAVWPNPWPEANDNLAAKDLQGHGGTLTECTVCHGNNDLGLTLDGPHGMHPVASQEWNKEHEEIAERNSQQCKTCHGSSGEGTVLSRTAAERQWICGERGSLCAREDQVIMVPQGTQVSCTQCHENKINGDD